MEWISWELYPRKLFFIKIALPCLHSSQWLAFDCAWHFFIIIFYDLVPQTASEHALMLGAASRHITFCHPLQFSLCSSHSCTQIWIQHCSGHRSDGSKPHWGIEPLLLRLHSVGLWYFLPLTVFMLITLGQFHSLPSDQGDLEWGGLEGALLELPGQKRRYSPSVAELKSLSDNEQEQPKEGESQWEQQENMAGDMDRVGMAPEWVALGPTACPEIGGEDWKVSVFLTCPLMCKQKWCAGSFSVSPTFLIGMHPLPCRTNCGALQERAIQMQPWGRSRFQAENTSTTTKHIPNLCLCEGVLEADLHVD